MDHKKIMTALRQLMEAVSDSDGRSGQAQEIIDVASRKLSKLYDYDFKEGESVYGDPPDPMHVLQLAKVEVYFLGENNNWSSEVVDIPVDVAKAESHDAFIKWLYSPQGEFVRETWTEWQRDVVGAYVMSWRDDLIENGGMPDVEVLITRATDGRWKAWGNLNLGSDEDTRSVFWAWEHGQHEVTIDNDEADYRIHTTEEAELHLKRLEALKSTDINIITEIESLKQALAVSVDDDLLDLESEDGEDEE